MAGYYNSTDPRDDWATPPEIAAPLIEEFEIDLDVCASLVNTKCPSHFDLEQNGLAQTWAPRRCWMNPPYGKRGAKIPEWTRKARFESGRGALIAAILPAKTETAWWHRDVLGCPGRSSKACRAGSCRWKNPLAEIRVIRGRVKFVCADGRTGPAPFATAYVIWHPGVGAGGEAARMVEVCSPQLPSALSTSSLALPPGLSPTTSPVR